MANRLPVPEELQHLIEKRNVDDDETDDRRSGEERRGSDLGPIGTLESGATLDELPTEDRRVQDDRRVADERRGAKRTTDGGLDPND
jgi:hypothetical protein